MPQATELLFLESNTVISEAELTKLTYRLSVKSRSRCSQLLFNCRKHVTAQGRLPSDEVHLWQANLRRPFYLLEFKGGTWETNLRPTNVSTDQGLFTVSSAQDQVFNCTVSALGLWTVDLWSPKAWIRSVSLRQNEQRALRKAVVFLWKVARMIMFRKVASNGIDSLKAESSDTGMTPNSELEPNLRGQMASAVGAINQLEKGHIHKKRIRAKLFFLLHEGKCLKPCQMVRISSTV